MANNRLFIRNRKTGKFTSLLKSFGDGWEMRKTAEQIEADVKELWDDGSYGNCYYDATDLELVTENDSRYKEVDGLLLEIEQTVTPTRSMTLRDRVPLLKAETTTGADQPLTVDVRFEMAATKKFFGMLATNNTLL
jgi:hypothetical protein